MHWPDLEPSEPEPAREDPPHADDEYISKHRLERIPDRRVKRYHMLPLKRAVTSELYKTQSQSAADIDLRGSKLRISLS